VARHLFALLAVAGAAGFGASFVAGTRADGPPPAAARIPPIPVVQTLAGSRCPIPARARAAFVDAAAETQLPLALLTAVGQVESQLSPRAQAAGSVRGVLLGPDGRAALEARARAAAQAVLAGARYLRAQFDRFRSSDRALAAYSAGARAAARSRAEASETLTYVADVSAIWRGLAGCG